MENSQKYPYFLSITLKNVRCFGVEQKLSLTDEQGKPARWTLILGDNGTGKTTLLKSIAACYYRFGSSEHTYTSKFAPYINQNYFIRSPDLKAEYGLELVYSEKIVSEDLSERVYSPLRWSSDTHEQTRRSGDLSSPQNNFPFQFCFTLSL